MTQSLTNQPTHPAEDESRPAEEETPSKKDGVFGQVLMDKVKQFRKKRLDNPVETGQGSADLQASGSGYTASQEEFYSESAESDEKINEKIQRLEDSLKDMEALRRTIQRYREDINDPSQDSSSVPNGRSDRSWDRPGPRPSNPEARWAPDEDGAFQDVPRPAMSGGARPVFGGEVGEPAAPRELPRRGPQNSSGEQFASRENGELKADIDHALEIAHNFLVQALKAGKAGTSTQEQITKKSQKASDLLLEVEFTYPGRLDRSQKKTVEECEKLLLELTTYDRKVNSGNVRVHRRQRASAQRRVKEAGDPVQRGGLVCHQPLQLSLQGRRLHGQP